MNDEQKKMYLAWLRDAHAMEMGLVNVLEKQVEEAKDEPEVQARIRQHLDETKNHAALIKGCIDRHGGDVSVAKDWTSQLGAFLSGLGMSFMDDKKVKNVHSSYAAEHFEIATYTMIRAAALMFGDTETASVCDDILDDEQDMADWLAEQMPMVVEAYMRTL